MNKHRKKTAPVAIPPPTNRGRVVTFEVHTAVPLPVGEQVFVAGSTPMLGEWRPDGFPLTRMGDLVWAGTAILPASEDVEYKITRGSWDTEEVDAEGCICDNHPLRANGDTTVRREVAGWRDEG
jgi:hypothetical protein